MGYRVIFFFGSFSMIVYSNTEEEMDEAVDSFKAEYSSETDQEVKDCISPD